MLDGFSPYKVGDNSRAICYNCSKVVPTTFEIRDVPFDDGSGVITDMLVAVCNECDAIVAIPAQSKLNSDMNHT